MPAHQAPPDSSQQDIELAWRGQYHGVASALRADGLAARVEAADPARALQARIVEAFWRMRHAPGDGANSTALAQLAEAAEAAQDWRFAAIARYGQALSLEAGPEHDLQFELQIATQALALCQRDEAPAEFDQAVFMNGLGAWHKAMGNWSESLEFLFRAADLATRCGEPGIAAGVHMNLGTVFFVSGNLDDALQAFQESWRTSQAAGVDYLRNLLVSNVALCLTHLNRVDEALQWIEPLLPVAGDHGPEPYLLWAVAAQAAATAGRFEDALLWAQRSVSLLDATARSPFRAMAHLALGRAQLGLGRSEEGLQNLLLAEEEAAHGGDDIYCVWVAEALSRAGKAQGDGAMALAKLEQVMHLRERLAGSAARTHVVALRIRAHLAELARERDRARAAQAAAEQALEELHAAQAELVRAEQRATAGHLIAVMAHQMNTPLGVCVTAASTLDGERAALMQALQAGPLKRAALNRFLAVSEGSLHLMLGNLRRLDRLGARFRRFATAPAKSRFALQDALSAAVRQALERAQLAPQRVLCELPSVTLFGDREALTEAVVELLDNALAATRSSDPPVCILAQLEATPPCLRLSVVDQGPGMPPELMRRALDPYAVRTDMASGLELGWRIVHHLVHHVLEGSVSLASEPGKGTTVVLSLPLEASAEGLSR